MFGSAGTFWDAFGCIRMHLDIFGWVGMMVSTLLRTGETGTHHDHGPDVRVFGHLVLVNHAGPFVAERVVYLLGACLDARLAQEVPRLGRVYLRLPEIAPGAGNALVEQHPVVLPEPVPCGSLKISIRPVLPK